MGVDPANYNPSEFSGLGAFLRRISSEFDDLRFKLQKETQIPISLVIVFPSESQEPGILSQITSSGRYGLLDPQALVGTTPGSEIGRWWARRRGLLTRAIVQLNAHALFLPATLSAHIVRQHGPEELQKTLEGMGWRSRGGELLASTLFNTDFGKFVLGKEIRAYEARGTPAGRSLDAYKAIAAYGLTQGKDKELNGAVAAAIGAALGTVSHDIKNIKSEKKLDFCSLIPDNSIYSPDGVLCVEYHWRSDDYLIAKNRSNCAQYILKKLRDYARQLGWTAD